MNAFKIVIAVALLAFLGACSPSPGQHATTRVQEYYHQNDGSELLYWYIIYSTLGNTTNTYYYSSPTRVSDWSSVTPTRVVGDQLPPEIQEVVSEGEALSSTQLSDNQEPAVVEQDQSALEAQYAEYAETQGQIDAASDASESAAPADTSSDSSSSSDAGDAGGGGSAGE